MVMHRYKHKPQNQMVDWPNKSHGKKSFLTDKDFECHILAESREVRFLTSPNFILKIFLPFLP